MHIEPRISLRLCILSALGGASATACLRRTEALQTAVRANWALSHIQTPTRPANAPTGARRNRVAVIRLVSGPPLGCGCAIGAGAGCWRAETRAKTWVGLDQGVPEGPIIADRRPLVR